MTECWLGPDELSFPVWPKCSALSLMYEHLGAEATPSPPFLMYKFPSSLREWDSDRQLYLNTLNLLWNCHFPLLPC